MHVSLKVIQNWMKVDIITSVLFLPVFGHEYFSLSYSVIEKIYPLACIAQNLLQYVLLVIHWDASISNYWVEFTDI